MAYRSGSTSTNLVGNLPAGTTTGDRLLAVLSMDFDGNSTTGPSGWTLIDSQENSGPDKQSSEIWYKTDACTNSEPSTYTWTGTAAGIVSIGCWSGRATGAPAVSTVAVSNAANASPFDITANGLTAAANDDLSFTFVCDVAGNGNLVTTTPPGSYTLGPVSEGSFLHAALCYRDAVSAGATGSVVASNSCSASSGWTVWLVAWSIGVTTGNIAWITA